MSLFQSLSQSQKIDFFIQCQILLLKYHPTSPFIIREDGLAKSLEAFRDNIEKYRAFYHRMTIPVYCTITSLSQTPKVLAKSWWKMPTRNQYLTTMPSVWTGRCSERWKILLPLLMGIMILK